MHLRPRALSFKHSTAAAALFVCLATSAFAADDDSAKTMDALTNQLIAGTLNQGTLSHTETKEVQGPAVAEIATPSVSPYGPEVMLRPVARNSFLIELQKGALPGAEGTRGAYMLRTAGYVIAHDVCSKFQMRVSSVAFRTNGDGAASALSGTVVCKEPKDKGTQA